MMLLELQREAIRRKGLAEFVRVYWDKVEAVELTFEPHMDLICRHLEACLLRACSSLKHQKQPWMDNLKPIADLVIAVPPGCSKTSITSVFFPAWAWTVCPSLKMITTSYSEYLATRDAKRSFELMQSDRFRQMYPEIEIVGGDRAAMTNYWTNAHGMRYATPMGGSVLGTHAHLITCDDPIKAQTLQGDTEAALSKVAEVWDNTFSSRSAHPATFTRIIIAQRLHMGDLSGIMIGRGAQHLCLPMEYDPSRHYESPWGSDWRTTEGELLLPKRFPQSVIDQRKAVLPSREWAAQYLQAPAPEDGSVFRRDWFQHRYPVGTFPWQPANIFLSVDCSLKNTSDADFTVIQAWAKHQGKLYLVDQIRARMGFIDQVQAITTMRSRWANVRQILIEAKANGDAVIQMLQQRFMGVIAIHPKGGKESRAKATEWLWESGSVVLPSQAPWLDTFIDEHLQFPAGKHDDCVDCASQALIWASKDRADLRRQASANILAGKTPWG